MSRASALGSPSLDPKKTPVSTSALLVLVNSFAVLEQRRLTPWSTGLATACHAWAPFHSGPSASCRCVPVTANVSPCSTLASPVEKLYKLFFEENILKYISLALALMLSGCASSGVVPLTADKFMISKNTVKFGGGISASAAAEVHEEANSFCTKQGKKVETVDLQLSPGRAGSAGSVTLQFRCI